jgi:hypothetical protein
MASLLVVLSAADYRLVINVRWFVPIYNYHQHPSCRAHDHRLFGCSQTMVEFRLVFELWKETI